MTRHTDLWYEQYGDNYGGQQQRATSEPYRKVFNYFADDPAVRAQAQRTVLLSDPDSGHRSGSEEVLYPARVPTEAEVGPRRGPYRYGTRPEQYHPPPNTDDRTLNDFRNFLEESSNRDVQPSRSLPQLLPNAETAESRQYENRRRTQSQGSTDNQRRPYAQLLPRSPISRRHGTTEHENPQDQ